MPPPYDIIIAGTGAAGFSLAYRILQTDGLRDQRMLLIDREVKGENDRTWCYWEAGDGLFDDILHHNWKAVEFFGNDFHKTLSLAPYRYKMVRGEDFYSWVRKELSKHPMVELIHGEVAGLGDGDDHATVTLADGQQFAGTWVFNSTPLGKPEAIPGKYNYLLQHFKGYEITANRPVFNPDRPVFMDFRVDQGGENDARFGYILPDSTTEGLIEYTVFSPDLWEQGDYDRYLRDYIEEYVGLAEGEYTVRREEYGVIPMTDQYFPPTQGKRIIQLGTVGGQTKASTGYTFQRIQHHTEAIITQWQKQGNPIVSPNLWNRRFSFYDAVLLEVIEKDWFKSRDIFTRIFQRNPETRIFRFLDESTTFGEEIKVLNTMPYLPFLRAVGSKLLKYTFR